MRRLAVAIVFAAVASAAACSRPTEPIRLPPVVVVADYRMPPVVMRGATRTWWKNASGPARFDDPLPVGITMYCLQGRTRRDHFVRPGIVAADPRYFPLAQQIELYVGRKLLGRFLIDDTGEKIHGARIDVWTADCAEARRFGIRRGTAVRVHAQPQVQLAGSAVKTGADRR